ncbi:MULTISPECIES: hypothetical protein [unclassified Lysobacter]|uniref:hypothetical protein n=1 Tax=unclassified Lysobacter TaxID=2635362 RepID=UPI001BE673A4|nr:MULTISPECIES: hypothetical protein [unclassified Lysobacter]MBT2746070.1 hypothetical protein [Lysobacter sp. ISL-42]MBT2752505.1 hypothetical protein [Lysobacter sp. ISL-50]MBT2776766.1 hypothetical protein [Lysobacter sp. ISL-54]MBT2780666.1 hypothetical protein [Lysobacter sp. ISL-52]
MTALRYQEGQDVRLGDSVHWGCDARGVVVAMLAEQAALPGYVAADWAYLQRGCIIEASASGLVHYDAEGLAQDEDLVLLARAT